MPDELDKKPTAGDVRYAFDHVNNLYGEGSEQAKLDREFMELYWDEHEIEKPDTDNKDRRRRTKPLEMRSGEAAREVDTICSFYPSPPQLSIKSKGDIKGEAVSARVEIGLAELIDQMDPTGEKWNADILQQVLLGRTARLQVPGNAYYWDNFPERGGMSEDGWNKTLKDFLRGGIPIIWEVLPAETTFPTSLGRQDEECLSWQSLSAFDLMVMFGRDAITKSGVGKAIQSALDAKKSDYKFTLIIYSNRQWISYVLREGEVTASQGFMGLGGSKEGWPDTEVQSIRHGMGKSAIRFLPGATTGIKKPGKYWISALYRTRHLIKTADHLLSLARTGARLNTMPTLQAEIDNLGSSLETDADIQKMLRRFEGDIWLRDAGREGEMKPVFQPPVGPETFALAEMALTRCERNSGVSEALRPTGREEVAWSTAFAAEVAARFFSRLSTAVGLAGKDLGELSARAVAAFGEPVYLDPKDKTSKGITLEPDEVAAYTVELAAEMKPQTAINKMAMRDQGLRMLAPIGDRPNPMGWPWIMREYFQEEDPLGRWKEAVQWDWFTSEQMRSWWLDTAILPDVQIELNATQTISAAEALGLRLRPALQEALARHGIQMPQDALGAEIAPIPPGTAEQGAVMAGAPFSRPPSGNTPSPTEGF